MLGKNTYNFYAGSHTSNFYAMNPKKELQMLQESSKFIIIGNSNLVKTIDYKEKDKTGNSFRIIKHNSETQQTEI